MSEALYSPDWYRVAALRPRLRPQVRVQRQSWRGQPWYLLCDDTSGRQHLVNEAAYQFIGRCDGRHDVKTVWNAMLALRAEAAPSQPEVVQLLAQLDELDLLQSERNANADTLFRRRDEHRQRRRRAMINPFAFRLSLGDPTRWLHRLDPLARALFTSLMLWVWAGLVLLGVLLVGAHWSELQAYAQERLLSPRSLALAWLCFPLVKALHEMGHALAVRRWGGEVHEFGIGLMLLVPAPYVDASASSRFTQRRERAAVAAAGILVETGLAALALLFWLSVQPGLARDIAFIVLMIGSVSTLAFNVNPLLRYDGYHVLCDALDLRNLAPRSHAWWSTALRRHALGAPADAPDSGRGERKWLIAYAPLSLVYRIGASLALVLWLGGKASLLGIAALAYVLIAALLLPLVRMARYALAAAAPGRERNRVRLGLAMLTLVPGLLLFVAPVPLATIAPAVVWLPEQAQVRPEAEGVVTSVAARDGEVVHEGDLSVALTSQPTADVTISIASNDTAEGTVATSSLIFTAANWNVAQVVTVTGHGDTLDDGDVSYKIVTQPAQSRDPNYQGRDPADVALVNKGIDDAPVVTARSVLVEQGSTFAFHGDNAINVADANGNLATVQVSATHGTLDLSLASGASLSAGALGSSTLTLAGSQSQIQAALATLTYRGAADFHGNDALVIIAADWSGQVDRVVVTVAVAAPNNAANQPDLGSDIGTVGSPTVAPPQSLPPVIAGTAPRGVAVTPLPPAAPRAPSAPGDEPATSLVLARSALAGRTITDAVPHSTSEDDAVPNDIDIRRLLVKLSELDTGNGSGHDDENLSIALAWSPDDDASETTHGLTTEVLLETVGLALSVGGVWWALRVGGLLTSLLASMPAWRQVDLLPVLPDDEGEPGDWEAGEDDEAALEEEAMAHALSAKEGGTR